MLPASWVSWQQHSWWQVSSPSAWLMPCSLTMPCDHDCAWRSVPSWSIGHWSWSNHMWASLKPRNGARIHWCNRGRHCAHEDLAIPGESTQASASIVLTSPGHCRNLSHLPGTRPLTHPKWHSQTHWPHPSIPWHSADGMPLGCWCAAEGSQQQPWQTSLKTKHPLAWLMHQWE